VREGWEKTAYLMDSYVLLTRENTMSMCASFCTYSHTTFISRSDGIELLETLRHWSEDNKQTDTKYQRVLTLTGLILPEKPNTGALLSTWLQNFTFCRVWGA